jgi:hypothetical protein
VAAWTCSGPFPKVAEVEEVDEDNEYSEDIRMLSESSDNNIDPSERIEDGDQIFCVVLPPESKFINTTSMVSQRLAEAQAKYA